MSLATPLPLERLCRLALVSRAGFYRWRNAPAVSERDVDLRDEIQRIGATVFQCLNVINDVTRAGAGSPSGRRARIGMPKTVSGPLVIGLCGRERRARRTHTGCLIETRTARGSSGSVARCGLSLFQFGGGSRIGA